MSAEPDSRATSGIEQLPLSRLVKERDLYAGLLGLNQQTDPEPLLSRARHRTALERAREALSKARPELGKGADPLLAAHHVRDAVAALDELIGLVHPDEVLGRVFERFCVGK